MCQTPWQLPATRERTVFHGLTTATTAFFLNARTKKDVNNLDNNQLQKVHTVLSLMKVQNGVGELIIKIKFLYKIKFKFLIINLDCWYNEVNC